MAESPTDDLKEHIKKNLSKGYKEDAIKWALINQGYSRTVVERAIGKATKEINNEEIKKEKSKKDSERPKIVYQLYDEHNKLIYEKKSKKSFWKKLIRR